MHTFDQVLEAHGFEQEWLVLVKKLVDVDFISVHQISLHIDFLMRHVNAKIGHEHPREVKKLDVLSVHKPVHQHVIGHLKGAVDAYSRHKAHSVRDMVKAHDLLKYVQLAEKRQLFVAIPAHYVNELVKSWVEEDLELTFDLLFVD